MNLVSSIMDSINPLPLESVLHISMNESSVNWNFLSLMSMKLKDDYNTKLINICSCWLHTCILYGDVMTRASETGWQIWDLLPSMYTLFKNTLTRRIDRDYKFCKEVLPPLMA